ncbi:MAG TPA: hypothetical protein VGN15_09250 [Ktedonobacteraceae bacterium]|jgi:hypothetical protein|nr:hypothetical protein [Ktedonobacteraceae bacterium]
MFSDTGVNVPESIETLKLQQKALIEGRRKVQMFPKGTVELELPAGMHRYGNERGVFHFNPLHIEEDEIKYLSYMEMENIFLELGPYSKKEIMARFEKGEEITCVAEYTMTGVEVRCALGTKNTIDIQKRFFEATMVSGNQIVVGQPPARVRHLAWEN